MSSSRDFPDTSLAPDPTSFKIDAAFTWSGWVVDSERPAWCDLANASARLRLLPVLELSVWLSVSVGGDGAWRLIGFRAVGCDADWSVAGGGVDAFSVSTGRTRFIGTMLRWLVVALTKVPPSPLDPLPGSGCVSLNGGGIPTSCRRSLVSTAHDLVTVGRPTAHNDRY